MSDRAYLVWSGPQGTVAERDAVMCVHCQRVVPVVPGRLVLTADLSPEVSGRPIELGWCNRCHAPICAACAATDVCKPFEAQLEELTRAIEHHMARDRMWAET